MRLLYKNNFDISLDRTVLLFNLSKDYEIATRKSVHRSIATHRRKMISQTAFDCTYPGGYFRIARESRCILSEMQTNWNTLSQVLCIETLFGSIYWCFRWKHDTAQFVNVCLFIKKLYELWYCREFNEYLTTFIVLKCNYLYFFILKAIFSLKMV